MMSCPGLFLSVQLLTIKLILKRDRIPPNWDILQFLFLRKTIKPSMYNFGISLTITTEERRQSSFLCKFCTSRPT